MPRGQDKLFFEIGAITRELGQLTEIRDVCQKAEAALQESEELVRCLIEKSLVGMFVIQDDRFAYVNAKFAKIFGFNQNEILQLRTLSQLVAKDSQKSVADNLRGAEKLLHFTFKGWRKDEQIVQCEFMGSRISFRQRPALIGTILDITKQKRIEKALLQNQTRLKLMQRISSGMRMRISLNERIKRTLNAVKSNFRRHWLLYGTVENGGNLTILHSACPGCGEQIAQKRVALGASFLRRMQNGRPIIVPNILHDKNLRLLAEHNRSFPVKSALLIPLNHSNKLCGVLCLLSTTAHEWATHEVQLLSEIADYLAIAIKDARTQHARKIAVDRLKRREERFQRVVQNIPVMLCVFGPQGNIVFWNRECERITGYKSEEVVDNPAALKIFQPQKSESEQLPHFQNRACFRDMEWQIAAKSGKVKTISWSSISKRFPIPGWHSWLIGVDITDRLEDASKLEITKDKYVKLFQESRDPIYLAGQDDIIIYCNDAFLALFNLTKRDIPATDIGSLFGERKQYADLSDKLLKYGEVKNLEAQLRSKNGVNVFALLSCTAKVDARGQFIGHQGIIHDITQRKQSEEILRNIAEGVSALTGEEFFRSLVIYLSQTLDTTFAMIAEIVGTRCDSLRTIAFCDRGKIGDNFTQRVGTSPAKQVLKHEFWECRENIREFFPEDETLAELGVISYMGISLIDSHGQRIGILAIMDVKLLKRSELTKSMLQIFGGRASGELERRLVERTHRESEEKHRLVVQNASESILILQHGSVCFFNKQALELTGLTDQELYDQKFIDLVHKEDRPEIRKLFRRMTLHNHSEKSEAFRLLEKGKKIKWVEATAIGLLWGGRRSKLLFLKDITKQKKLQEDLARAQRLESAGRVAGQIAHDFNNLLSPLAAYPGIIRDELGDEHLALQEMLLEIEDSAHKLAEINQQLLTLGRRGHYTTEAVDLNELVKKVLRVQAVPRKVLLTESFAPDLFLIKGGPAQLTRAITNLVINAIEAMDSEGRLTIRTRNTYVDKPFARYPAIKRGEYVELYIRDTGTGIKPEHLGSIFDPFFTTKRMSKERGSGLGLSVVHGIVEDHNAYIMVDSKAGKGAAFTILFPVARHLGKLPRPAVVKSRGGTERILVVDDDPIQRKVARQLLRRLGYHVHVLSSGETAVKHMQNKDYDLLVMDMVMGGIDGAETYRRILQFQPNQKAIILSGYAMTNRVQAALRLGAGTFVSKPVSQSSLAEAVRKELDRKRRSPRLN